MSLIKYKGTTEETIHNYTIIKSYHFSFLMIIMCVIFLIVNAISNGWIGDELDI